MGAPMIGKAERNQQVTPDALEQRDQTGKRAKDAADELEVLRQRIATAKMLVAQPHEVHCRDCFEKGRDAALRIVEGDE